MRLKSAIFIGVAVVLLLALTSCDLFTGASVIDPNDPCSALDGSAKDNCYFESRQCSKIESARFRDSCVVELAKQKDDAAVCNLIVDAKTKGYCQEQLAIQQDNFDLCKEIEDVYWQDNCFYHVAIGQNNADRCAYVSDISTNLDCVKKVAIATADLELCDRLSEQNRAECLFRIAEKTLDAEPCARFTEDTLDASSCYLKVAKLTKNKALCSKIPIKDIQEYCKGYFAAN